MWVDVIPIYEHGKATANLLCHASYLPRFTQAMFAIFQFGYMYYTLD